MKQVGFKGSMQDFFKFMQNDPRFSFKDEPALLAYYRGLEAKINQQIPQQFSLIPKAPFEIRPVEAFRAQSAAGGSYMRPSEDGSRPGIFYVNTYDLPTRKTWDAEDLYLHEAIPGHHFQLALQQELTNLPKFRRFGGETAFSEGWGLYAESLGKDLGVYTDPYNYFGYLQNELWRAIRLVVDTGLHSKGWTREQVIQYMLANSAESETQSTAEAERYMAIPGQALAYKIGELKIQELRARAEKALGAEVRRARVPRRSAEGRLGAAGSAGRQDRPLDRRQARLSGATVRHAGRCRHRPFRPSHPGGIRDAPPHPARPRRLRRARRLRSRALARYRQHRHTPGHDGRCRKAKAEQLNKLYAEYWEENLKLNPVLATFQGDPRYNDQLPDYGSAQYRDESKRFTSDWLKKIEAIGPQGLDGQDLLSYEIFVADAKDSAGVLPVPDLADAGEPDGQPRHARGAVRLRHRRAAVQDGQGLRRLAQARRPPAGAVRHRHRQHARWRHAPAWCSRAR